MQKSGEIAQWLREEIQAERPPAGGKVPSEYELARRFAVNKITANKAVAALVSEGLLERGPRGTGTFVKRGCGARGSMLLLLSVGHPYYALIADGAQREALARGYLTLLATPPAVRLNEFLRGLDGSVAKGIVTSLYGWIDGPPGVPVVHTDLEFPPEAHPPRMVNADCFSGAELATEEMLNRGHRDIVFVGSGAVHSRAAGFVAAATKAGVADARERVFVHRESPFLRLLDDMFRKFPGLTGIVTGSDDYAFELSLAGKRRGLAIPGDLAMTGFGNVRVICELLELTSVEQHPAGIGAFAMGRAIDLAEGKCQLESFTELIPCELVRRQSVPDVRALKPR